MTLTAEPIYEGLTDEAALRDAIEAASRKLLPRLELDDVADYYGLTRAVELGVLKFLTRYPKLVSTLLEARPHIDHIFPNAEEVYLEVDEDPEGGFDELFGVFVLDATPDLAIAKLREFDRSWFGDASRATDNRLNFTVALP